MKIRLKIYKNDVNSRKMLEIRSKTLENGDIQTYLVEVPYNSHTPECFVIRDEIAEKSFPGHRGIPGHRGGSLPRSGSSASAAPVSHPLLRLKSQRAFLFRLNIDADTLMDLDADLADALLDAFAQNKKSSWPMSMPRLKYYVGEDAYERLMQFKKEHTSKSKVSTKGITAQWIKDNIKFDDSVSSRDQKLIIDMMVKYNINIRDAKYIEKISFAVPSDSDYTEASDRVWERKTESDIKQVIGVCVGSPSSSSHIRSKATIHINAAYIRANYSSGDIMEKTLLHEIAHVTDDLMPKKVAESFRAFYEKLKPIQNEAWKYGLRDYSFTNTNEFHADVYTSIKYTSTMRSYHIAGLKMQIPSDIWNYVTE